MYSHHWVTHLRSNARRVASRIVSTIFPPFCQYCLVILSYDALLCHRCIQLIHPIASWRLAVTKTYAVTVHALSRYDDPLKNLIGHKFRSSSTTSVLLGRFMAEKLPLSVYDIDYLVPVPLHWRRYVTRGYNQAELMAKEMNRVLQIPMYRHVVRMRHTQYQSSLPIDQRRGNIGGSFQLRGCRDEHKNLFRDKTIVIVDDLSTTGETIREMARLFLPFRPRMILAAVVCRARV